MEGPPSTANLRRKDTTKGAPLRILSLDGGGVRGFSMLIILENLMHQCFVEANGRPPKPDEKPKPCQFFDLIAGTGTGGLIALMLGRLRLDLETCRAVYVRMTRKVFETDKTIGGIPYKRTLFKASRLEEAIRECVREHTVYEDEGNDGTNRGGHEFMVSPSSPVSGPQRAASVRSTTSFGVASPLSLQSSVHGVRWGNPNASLYDDRENRTKTAVTAVLKGTKKHEASILLRSYESRREAAPEYSCTIWQAGRATCATGLAFKPIQIGNYVFNDDGPGKYNPTPQILEEAVVNEWPGRDLGILVSIGTGKRPGGTSTQSAEWWEGFVGGTMGNFAEARRRLIAKIEGCEETHQSMMASVLPQRGIPLSNYCRLNVEVGVGEFGMNEWDRLPDISNNTRQYLDKIETQKLMADAAARIGKIELTKRRFERQEMRGQNDRSEKILPQPPNHLQAHPPAHIPARPGAFELSGEDAPGAGFSPISPSQLPMPRPSGVNPPYPRHDMRVPSPQDKFIAVPSEDRHSRVSSELPSRHSGEYQVDSPYDVSPRRSGEDYGRPDAPPIPPKTPINDNGSLRPLFAARPSLNKPPLPYPDFDGPPPPVNKSLKPKYSPR